MTDTAWKPTPGRDAMTRDGRRVHVERYPSIPIRFWVWPVGLTRDHGWLVHENGLRYDDGGKNMEMDLVRDADPTPDEEGLPHDVARGEWLVGPGGKNYRAFEDLPAGCKPWFDPQDIGAFRHGPLVPPSPSPEAKGEPLGALQSDHIVAPLRETSGPVREKMQYTEDQKHVLMALAYSIISGEPLESKYCRTILDIMARMEALGKAGKEMGNV